MAKRTKKPKPGTIRSGAVRAEVYNEGLCVYLYDAANADRLRAMIADKKKYPRCKPERTFFENLSDKKFGKDAAAAGLAVAYTLDQDDEVSVEVAVGEPLTEKELSIACWLEPQRAKISLPSGRLRIETPNTIPIELEEKTDEGAEAAAPPGDYVLTLYRVDWEELRRSGKKYKGPQEFILLTPIKKAGRAPLSGPILEWTPRKQASPGAAKAKAGSAEFKCQIVFLGYWENYGINFTRAGAAKMCLEPGARLRFMIEKLVMEGLYLGEMTPKDFMRFYPKARLEKDAEAFKEFALSEWTKMPGREFLAFRRIQAAKCIPERLIDKWHPAQGVILPEKWDAPRPAPLPPPTASGGAIRAGVTFSSAEEVILNVEPAHLEAIGAKAGDLLRLRSPGAPARTLSFGASIDAQSYHTLVTGAVPKVHEEFYNRMAGNNPNHRFFARPGAAGEPVYEGELPAVRLREGDPWPVVGVLLPDVGSADRLVLRVTPASHNGNDAPASWTDGLAAGALLEISKA